MPAIYLHAHTVAAAEIDGQGHANNLAFLKWMQDAAIAHSTAQGWSGEAYQKLAAGWVVRSHHIEYRQPAFEDEPIVVRTWVADMKKVTSLRRYEIVRPTDDGETLLAVAATDWAFVNLTTRQPKRIPPEVAGSFEIVADSPTPSLRGEG